MHGTHFCEEAGGPLKNFIFGALMLWVRVGGMHFTKCYKIGGGGSIDATPHRLGKETALLEEKSKLLELEQWLA